MPIDLNVVVKSLSVFHPELVLTGGMLLVVVIDAIRGSWRDAVNFWVTALALIAAGGLCIPLRHASAELWYGMVVLDPMAVFFKMLLIGASLLVLLMFRRARELQGLVMSEFYALLLAVTLSNLLLATANDLVMLYLALEMVSVTSYVMVAYMKGDRLSNEASLKYILFGAVSTGVMLYGLSLLYGMAGTTSLPRVHDALVGMTDESRLTLYVVALLVFAGFGFKTASVPFHFWCPDVYQGAPTPVTAFLSVAPKAAGFAVMMRFFFSGFTQTLNAGKWDLKADDPINWQALLIVISVLTMTVGNIAALTQTNMKRLLAYSSIAHAGYILMGIVAASESGARAILIYLLAYVFMNLGAFLVVTLIHYYDGTFDLRDYPGLHRRAPLLTVAMAFFLLSLMGIPPLVGFMGKLYVFAAVVNAAGTADPSMASWLYAYAVIGAVNAAVAAYYYARVLKTITIDAGNEDKPVIAIPVIESAWITLLVAANVLPLLFWSHIEDWARGALALYAGR